MSLRLPPKPVVVVEPKGDGPLAAARARAVSAAVKGALAFLGYEPPEAPAPCDLRIAVEASSRAGGDFEARGFSLRDFHYYCLKTHPRAPLALDWDALSAARSELGALRAAAAALSGVTAEPSSRGLAGYLHRFREGLSRDFDFPEALSCLWDGLRPGALSPGSRAAFLRAALPALGLD